MRATAAATLLLLRANATNAEIEWKAWGGREYSLVGTSPSFDGALARCALHGGYPVSITSQGEQDFVYQNVCEGRTCWLGLVEYPNSEQYYWVDGSGDLAWSNWFAEWGSPGNHGGDQEYAVMNALDCAPDGEAGPTGRTDAGTMSRTPGPPGTTLSTRPWTLAPGRTCGQIYIVCERAEGSSDALFVAGPRIGGDNDDAPRLLLKHRRIDRHHP